jgi:hypothetical protein
MAKQSPAQKRTVERVMHEFKHSELESRGGRKVKSPRQAIAIALHEAGASKYESAEDNRKALRQTKTKERKGETGMDEAEGRGASRRITGVGKGKGSSATAKSADGGKTKDELYAEARKRDIAGRSRIGQGGAGARAASMTPRPDSQ